MKYCMMLCGKKLGKLLKKSGLSLKRYFSFVHSEALNRLFAFGYLPLAQMISLASYVYKAFDRCDNMMSMAIEECCVSTNKFKGLLCMRNISLDGQRSSTFINHLPCYRKVTWIVCCRLSLQYWGTNASSLIYMYRDRSSHAETYWEQRSKLMVPVPIQRVDTLEKFALYFCFMVIYVEISTAICFCMV